jgi:hypothetical protein
MPRAETTLLIVQDHETQVHDRETLASIQNFMSSSPAQEVLKELNDKTRRECLFKACILLLANLRLPVPQEDCRGEGRFCVQIASGVDRCCPGFYCTGLLFGGCTKW